MQLEHAAVTAEKSGLVSPGELVLITVTAGTMLAASCASAPENGIPRLFTGLLGPLLASGCLLHRKPLRLGVNLSVSGTATACSVCFREKLPKVFVFSFLKKKNSLQKNSLQKKFTTKMLVLHIVITTEG